MDRYLIFGSDECYYAQGGMNDFICAVNDVSDILPIIKSDKFGFGNRHSVEWWHVYDAKRKNVFMGSQAQPHGADNLSGCSLENTYVLKSDHWISLSSKNQQNKT